MAAANDGTLEFASTSSSSSSSNHNNTNNNNNNGNNSNNSSGGSNSSSNSIINNNHSSNSSNGSSSNSSGGSGSNSSNYAGPSTLALSTQAAAAAPGALGMVDPRYGCVAPLLPPPPLPPPLAPPPRSLEQLIIYENFDVHETHRIEDGVCTHITRLPPKKQELLKQFGIQSSSQQCLSNYEKYIIIENFIKFCNEYQISDHRPFLDFHESALSKCEQLKFVRYLGQGLSNLTLNKIYVAFKELLGNARLDKSGPEAYNLDAILKKKRKNLYNRLHAAAPSLELQSAYETQQQQQQQQPPQPLPLATQRHAFAALNATARSDVCNDLAHASYSYVPR